MNPAKSVKASNEDNAELAGSKELGKCRDFTRGIQNG